MNMTEAVMACVELIVAAPDSELDEIMVALEKRGISHELAGRLCAFVPMAFARAILSEAGASLPAGYEIRDEESGRSWRGLLSQEPVYNAAQEVAGRLGTLHADVWRVAAYSPEMILARNLVEPGQGFDKIVLVEAVMYGIPIPPERMRESEAPPQKRKSWWKFWDKPR
jgi:hypothetical protein